MEERRQRRSIVRDEALSLVLAAEAARSGAQAVVLADLDGLLVAGAGDTIDHDALAALAAVAHDPRPYADVARSATVLPLRVAPIRVRDASLLCASLGHGFVDPRAVEAAADRIVGS